MKKSLLAILLLFLSLAGYCQCTLTVNITSSSPAICSGATIVLTANVTGGIGPYNYVWNTGKTGQSIPVNKVGTYTVTVSDNTPGCTGVVKTITVTGAPVPAPPTASGVTVCPNSSATLTATAPGGTYQWYDAATGGNFLGTGATYSTPPITTPTIFYVQTTLNNCTSERTAVTVNLIKNPVGKGATVCYNSSATLSATGGDTYSWYASSAGGAVLGTGATFTTPALTTTTTYYVVATTNGCVSQPVAVTANVLPEPPLPNTSNVAICSGSVASLHATVSSGIIDWFDAPTGGTSLISGTDFTTPVLTATTTYYVQNTVGGCSSTRVPVTVTVNPLPQPPTAAGATVCGGSNATLTASGSPGTYEWYSASTGGTLLATGSTFVTPALNSTTIYYLQADNGTCTSTRVPVQVTVQRPPSAPSAPSILICSGTAATLVATSPSGGNYQWFDAPTGGNLLASTATFTTPVLTANTTYYVQTTVGTCESPRSAVQVSILPPTTPPSASNASVCTGNSTTLTASGGNGNYQWYDAATGGNLLSTAQVFVTPALTITTTYYVQTTSSNGCASTRTPVTVTVNPLPAAPVANGTTVCPGSSVSLTATASGTVQWYNAASGGTLLSTGSNYTTPILNTTTTYYVENISGTCPSPRTPVTVTVNGIPNPQFFYSSGTYCISSGNPTPTINNPAGGTFSSTPGGLVFVSTTTGEINIAASTPGTYVVSFAGNGTCPVTSTATISITSSFNSQFSYSGPFCQNAANPLPVFTGGASAGTFSVTPAGLVFVNPSTGEIDLSKSTPGTYNVTNTIAGSGSCAASVFTSSVTIDPAVVVNAGPNQTISAGTTAQLAGSVSGGATTGTWSGGTGSFSNPNSLTAVYTPGAGETSAVLTLTSADPTGPCGPVSNKVTITINPIPAAPTVPATSTCMGGNSTLSATAPGGTYQWYDAATGGNLLATGPSFTTPPLTANTTYYVQTTVGAATSPRAAVTVAVNPPPAAPVAPSQIACYGYVTTLTASGSTGTYEWYDAPIGGNLLATGSTFTTDIVTDNLTYYVQTTVNGCSSTRTQVNITLKYIANITSPLSANICSGNAMNYTITADLPGTTFVWSRAAVPGISNPAVANQTTSAINETLINTTNAPVNVIYIISPTTNGCTGESFHYVVTVYPLPQVTSAASATVCNESPVSYTITFNIPGVNFTWSRAAVPGISDAAVAGQTSSTINETLTNTTNTPVNVTYVFTYSAGNCTGTFNYIVTVNPSVSVISAQSITACSGVPLNYAITANVPSPTFTWSRTPYIGISNPPVSNQTSSTINEALVNTTTSPVYVGYTITPTGYGCTGSPFTLLVEVFPQPDTPVANSNSPVCVGSTIQLQTPLVPGAIYQWTGPNGFSSSAQNPTISNVTTANTGTYTLLVLLNGCASPPATVQAVVDEPPVTDAGPDQPVCNSIPSVQLAGSVKGGTTTGVWTTAGSGTFTGGLSSTNILNAQYFPSAQDRAAGSVKLTLGSTSNDDCAVSTSTMTITFQSAHVTSAATGAVCTGTAQNYSITADLPGSTYVWSRAAVPGITNAAISNQTSSTITETLFNPGTTPVDVVYVITPSSAGCQGVPFNYTVTVNPQPVIPTATASTPVCVGSNIQLQTPLIPGATYAWTGPAGFTSASQNPIVSNVTQANTGTYSVVVTVNGCPSQPGTVDAVVDLPPVANAGSDRIVCATASSVTLAGIVRGGTTTGVWSTNGTGTFTGGGNTTTDLNGQYFPSAQDIANGSVTLTLTSTSNDNCTVATSPMIITFQAAQITSAATGAICTGTAQNYTITSNIPGTTYTWSRPAVMGISNGPAVNQTSSSITETLFNNGTTPIDVIYTIVPAFNGCAGEPFTYTVTVNPQPVTPTITALTAVCVGSTIHLQTPAIPGATYSWTGPAGFSSASQNPDVTNVTTANAGVYTLIVSVNGCTSQPATVNAIVDLPPVASAGPDQIACPSTTAVTLTGSVTGGTFNTGVWTTAGTGTFTGGGNSTTVLTGQYFPSAQDISNGSVTLTLASTSNDDCNISTSTMTIKFQLLQAVTAGPNQSICTQGTAQLAGQITIPGGGVWTTSGTGTFNPNAGTLNATYIPSADDIKSGSVVLTLTANAAGQCYIPSDKLTINLIPPPTVNAGGTVYVLRGHTITLNPTVSDPNVQYLWSPDVDISNTTIRNPVITGDVDRTYTLTVTDSRGCVTQDQVKVLVAPELTVPNAFTPNGDGINDQWNIVGLSAYQQAVVDIFDRNGQKVYHSIGYGIPWDGTYKGKEVPFGVYYYVIDTKVNGVVLSGYVTVIR